MDQIEIGAEFLKALHRYFTPVGVGLVLSALICNPAMPQPVFKGSIALLVASLLFNVYSAVYIIDHPAAWRRWGYIRVGVNLAINAGFYVLLHAYWPIVWVLFALGPIAMAFYGDATETFAVLSLSGFVMAACLLADHNLEAKAWAEVGARVFFILLVSLFLIKVAALVPKGKAERKA